MGEAEGLQGSMFSGMNYLYAGFRCYDVTGEQGFFVASLAGTEAMVALHHPKA